MSENLLHKATLLLIFSICFIIGYILSPGYHRLKYPLHTEVYVDEIVDIGYVSEFDPTQQIVVRVFGLNNETYLRVFNQEDVYEYSRSIK